MAYLEICNSKARGLYSNPEFMGLFLRCLNDSETEVEVEPTWAATVRNFRLAKNRWLRMIDGFEEKMLSAFSTDILTCRIISTQHTRSMDNVLRNMSCRTMNFTEMVHHYEEQCELAAEGINC